MTKCEHICKSGANNNYNKKQQTKHQTNRQWAQSSIMAAISNNLLQNCYFFASFNLFTLVLQSISFSILNRFTKWYQWANTKIDFDRKTMLSIYDHDKRSQHNHFELIFVGEWLCESVCMSVTFIQIHTHTKWFRHNSTTLLDWIFKTVFELVFIFNSTYICLCVCTSCTV